MWALLYRRRRSLGLNAGAKAAPNSAQIAQAQPYKLSEISKTAHRRCGWLYGRSRWLHFPYLDDGYYPYYANPHTYYPYYHGAGLYYWGEHIRSGHRR